MENGVQQSGVLPNFVCLLLRIMSSLLWKKRCSVASLFILSKISLN